MSIGVLPCALIQDCDDISAGSASCPPPPAPPPSVVGGAGTPTDHVGGAGAPSMSLAGLLQQSSAEDQASLLELIEVSVQPWLCPLPMQNRL